MENKNRITPLISLGILLLFLFSLPAAKAQTIYKMPSRPFGAVVVDYDLDGDNELIIGSRALDSNDADSIVIMFNDGWGNFERLGFEANCDLFIYCEDMNNDSYPDIISRDGDSIFYYENDKSGGLGGGYFIGHTIGNRWIGGIADMDTNGYKDIVYYNNMPPYGWGIIYNEGGNIYTDDFFIQSQTGARLVVTVGDLNLDSIDDVLITSNLNEEGAYAMINETISFKKEMLINENYNSSFIADIDSFGANDIGLIDESPSILGNTKVFSYFNDSLNFISKDTAFLTGGGQVRSIEDFDLDGYPDLALIVASWTPDPAEDSIFIYKNTRSWNYRLIHKHFIGERVHSALFSGDLNMDGYADIIVFGYLIPTRDFIQILWNDRNGGFVDTNNVYVTVKEQKQKNDIQLFPNPTSGFIKILSEKENIVEVKIIDLNGRLLFEEKNPNKSRNMHVDLKQFINNSGLYTCIIRVENNLVLNKKIIFINQISYEKH